jgi:cytochrome c biogenesis protein CcmG/thiol:disulfide interchange protein DsbE
MSSRVAAIALAAVLAITSAASHPSAVSDVTPLDARKPAPDLVLHDSAGGRVRLSDYKGKVLLLDFWATWCTGCKEEIPWFMEFQKKYGARGLASLGVAMDDEGWRAVTPYLRQHPINYRIVVQDEAFASRFPITGLPLTLLIDRSGRIVDSHDGMVDKAAWERKIRALLEERAPR